MTENSFDVVVVGGGAAGLAGALSLVRSRRTVLVIDAGDPRNASADQVHNYLGREGTPPAELYAIGRAEIEEYGAEVRSGRAVSAAAIDGGFSVGLEDGSTATARRLLVTTGARDVLPEIPGLAERWGKDVLHCPYCHGWEVRDRAIGVIASSAMVTHHGLLFRQLSDDVVVFLDGRTDVSQDDLATLRRRGVRIVAEPVAEVLSQDDRLTGVRLESGEVVAREAVVVATVVEARSEVLTALGAEVAPFEMNGITFGTQVVVDPTGRTTVPGVWAAGNVTTVNAQVITSAAAGLWAGAQINADLVMAEAAESA